MDFDFNEEQKMAQRVIRDFLKKEIAPIVDIRERERQPFTREEMIGLIKKLMPFGFYIGRLPEKYGGVNLDLVTDAMLHEELGKIWGSLVATISICEGAIPAILNASDELKKRLLPRLLEGELIGCIAITEPNVGSNTAAIETNAILDSDEWVINGTKTWLSNATIADIAIVMCVTDKSKGPQGISRILVEKSVSPFEVRKIDKMGLYCFPTGEVVFDNCRVPKENIIMDPGSGYQTMMRELAIARVSVAMAATGICQAAIDASIKYAQQRFQFGRPIGSFQMIQDMIVDMITETEAARLLAYRAQNLIQKGGTAFLESSLAKSYASEASVRVTSKAVSVHGAMGLSDDFPVSRYYRDARILTTVEGTTQIQKLVIGREAIGIKAFT